MALLAAGTFNDGEMDLAGTGYQVHTDALIKAHKPAAMGNAKRQEVAIGDLAGKVLGCTYNHVHTAMASLPSRVFMNGHSQAVRIPAEFRLATDRVQISRTAEGDLLIHPCPSQRP
jgi:hypothetical protein